MHFLVLVLRKADVEVGEKCARILLEETPA